MTERRIEYRPLDEVVPAPRNAKAHAGEALQASVGRFGYTEPLLLDERTGRLVAGHGRLEALTRRQAEGGELPDGVQEVDGKWLVPVVRGWASKDDAEAEAYVLASNRLSEVGGWDTASLGEILSGLEVSVREVTGFSEADLDLILAELAARTTGPTDPLAAWAGMPSADNRDLSAAFTVTIHFPTEADADDFFRDVLQRAKVRSLWWPKHDGYLGSDVHERVVVE